VPSPNADTELDDPVRQAEQFADRVASASAVVGWLRS